MEKERRYNEDQERKKIERKERELQIVKNYKQQEIFWKRKRKPLNMNMPILC